MQPCSLIAKWRGQVSNSWLCLVEALEPRHAGEKSQPVFFQTKDPFGLGYIESKVKRYAGRPSYKIQITEIHRTLLPPFQIVSYFSNFLEESKYFRQSLYNKVLIFMIPNKYDYIIH